MNASNNYALITGATSGIGYELAKIFAANHYNLIIVSRDFDALRTTRGELIESYDINVFPISKDLFDRQSPFELYEEIKALNINIDILVNNAAQTVYGKFIDTDIKDEFNILQLNIGAYLTLTKLFLRDMVIRGSGRILNVSSIAGKIPGPYQSVYHGTKAFIHSFTESIRAEIDGSGVTITSLLPGLTDTDIFHKAHMENSKLNDMKLADPADVARDGYEALMRGDDKVISGLSNKALVAAANIIPDETLAKVVASRAEPRAPH